MAIPITFRDRGVGLLASVAVVLLVACAGCQTNTYTHSKFSERSARLTRVAMLPPHIRTTLADKLDIMQPGSPLPEETAIRADLPRAVAEGFRSHGLAMKESAAETQLPDATNPNWDPRLLGVLNAAYDSVHLRAVRPEAKVLSDHVQADGLIFLNVFAYKSTEGRKTKAAAMNVFAVLGAYGGSRLTPYREAIVQITLVDGETGDVLWRTKHDFHDLEKTAPDQVVAELFKHYPKR